MINWDDEYNEEHDDLDSPLCGFGLEHCLFLGKRIKEACEQTRVKPIHLKNATRHSFGMGLLHKGYDIW